MIYDKNHVRILVVKHTEYHTDTFEDFHTASANEHAAPPLSCFVLFPFHIPFGLMPATASEKILARLLCWTGNSTRGKSLEILGHFHFPI